MRDDCGATCAGTIDGDIDRDAVCSSGVHVFGAWTDRVSRCALQASGGVMLRPRAALERIWFVFMRVTCITSPSGSRRRGGDAISLAGRTPSLACAARCALRTAGTPESRSHAGIPGSVVIGARHRTPSCARHAHGRSVARVALCTRCPHVVDTRRSRSRGAIDARIASARRVTSADREALRLQEKAVHQHALRLLVSASVLAFCEQPGPLFCEVQTNGRCKEACC